MSGSDRLLDAGLEVDLENESPLVGVDEAESLSLKEALERGAHVSGLTGTTLASCLHAADKRAKRVLKQGTQQPLNSDEIGAIHLYTQETPLYRNLNRLLRQRNRQELKPLFSYLKLLMTALHKLPPLETVVYRGVKEDLSSKYVKEDDIVWWGFSSTTASVEILQHFAGTTGSRTIFAITVAHAVDIRCYSAMEYEDERLLLPGLQLQVTSKVNLAPDLVMVQLKEDRNACSLIPGFQFAMPSSPTTTLTPPHVAQVLELLQRKEGLPWADIKKKVALSATEWSEVAEHCRSHCEDSWCQVLLGLCYECGDGVAKDANQAVRLYRLAADQGHACAQFNLGFCYEKGQGVPKDFNEAVRLYRLAADQGNANAQCNLGFCYDYGKGVTKDISEAVRLYRLAADQGNAIAQSNLGVCYENGQGVPKDFNEAVRLYRLAADQGNAGAQFNLGFCYENGQGVPKDFNEAVRLYRLAADQGNSWAQEQLARLT